MINIEEYYCFQCAKKYADITKYQTHMKLKHKQYKIKQKITNDKQIIGVEDKIYSYMGELSQIYSFNSRTNSLDIPLDQHKLNGQANYLVNPIVRTPYENQINIVSEIPKQFKFTPRAQISLTEQRIMKIVGCIGEDIDIFTSQLNKQRKYWQFADPYETSIDFTDEFSILDIPKLLKNYSKRYLKIRNPEITIFITWIARICKPQMFKLIYQIIVSQEICYQNYLQTHKSTNNTNKTIKYWQDFINQTKLNISKIKQNNQRQQNEENQYLNLYAIQHNTLSISIQKLQKLLQLYQSWTLTIIPFLYSQTKQTMQKTNKNKDQ